MLARLKQRLHDIVDVLLVIALEVEGDIVLFENEILRVFGKPDGLDQGPFTRLPFFQYSWHQLLGYLGWDVILEIGKAISHLGRDTSGIQRINRSDLPHRRVQTCLRALQCRIRRGSISAWSRWGWARSARARTGWCCAPARRAPRAAPHPPGPLLPR